MHQGHSQEVAVYEGGSSTVPAVCIDSLPYYDVLHEDYEEYALALVEQEMQNSNPTMSASQMQRMPPFTLKSPILSNSYHTLSAHHSENQNNPPPELDLKHRAQEPSTGSNDVDAWRSAVRDARAEYEAERQRATVLEIEKSHASTHPWKCFGTMLETIHGERQRLMETEKEAVDRINAARQLYQEKEGRKLQQLTLQFQGAVHQRFQLLAATQDLERTIRLHSYA